MKNWKDTLWSKEVRASTLSGLYLLLFTAVLAGLGKLWDAYHTQAADLGTWMTSKIEVPAWLLVAGLALSILVLVRLAIPAVATLRAAWAARVARRKEAARATLQEELRLLGLIAPPPQAVPEQSSPSLTRKQIGLADLSDFSSRLPEVQAVFEGIEELSKRVASENPFAAAAKQLDLDPGMPPSQIGILSFLTLHPSQSYLASDIAKKVQASQMLLGKSLETLVKRGYVNEILHRGQSFYQITPEGRSALQSAKPLKPFP